MDREGQPFTIVVVEVEEFVESGLCFELDVELDEGVLVDDFGFEE